MDEAVINFFKPKCKAQVGDIFYRVPKPGNKPDRIEVIDIQPHDEGWIVTGKFLNHVDGPSERKYFSSIFDGDQYVIEKKSSRQ